MAERKLRLRWAGACATCQTPLPAGTEAWWNSEAKTATCGTCHDGPPPIDSGVAGASAAAEYQRRSQREAKRKQAVVDRDNAWRDQVRDDHPLVGRVVTALTPKPVVGPESHATTAWKTGAEGEQGVARTLAACPNVIALHDRRVPRTKGNIDHLAVGPAGVFVIDAKRYTGRIERRDRGSVFRPDVRLYVDRRDRTKLVQAMDWQTTTIRNVLNHHGHHDIPLRAVLCFVDAEWPLLFARPLQIAGVTVLWPKALQGLVTAGDLLNPDQRDHIARDLAAALPTK